MIQKNIISKLILVIIFSLVIIHLAVSSRDIIYSSNSTHNEINQAQLTQVGPIEINNNSDWSTLSGNPWFQGNGSALDPYVISNISIDAPYGNCIAINYTDVHFIIQNCRLSFNTGLGGIYLQNVYEGIIFNNEFKSDYEGSCIRLQDCYSVTIINNKATDASSGIYINNRNVIFEDKINASGNLITDCYIGISLSYCDYSSFSNNEIRLTEAYPGYEYSNIGIRLFGSNYNNITENHLYCLSNTIEVSYYPSSTGNLIENNYFHSCTFYIPEDALKLDLLISGILLAGGIVAIFLQHYRFPKRKVIMGIILMVITLSIMGLLIHGVYNLNISDLMDDFFYRTYYTAGLIFLFSVNSALLLFGLNLIRKGRRERGSIKSLDLG